jgi:hypothetical protein
MRKNSTAESGANAGSDWQLIARADDGSNLGTALLSTRSTGALTVGYGVNSHLFLPFDNQEIKIGAGTDLRFYHDGTNSYIRNDTGSLNFNIGTTTIAQLRSGGNPFWTVTSSADNAAVGLFVGNTKALRMGATSVRANIEGVDSTGFGSFQPLRVGGSELEFAVSSTVCMAIETTLAVDVRQQFQLSNAITPAQLTANTDNYSPTGLSTASVLRLSTDASRNLTGIAAQPAGTRLTICNVGTQDLVLIHDATSTAANRFFCPGSVNKTLNTNDSVDIWYDSSSTRWRVIDN